MANGGSLCELFCVVGDPYEWHSGRSARKIKFTLTTPQLSWLLASESAIQKQLDSFRTPRDSGGASSERECGEIRPQE